MSLRIAPLALLLGFSGVLAQDDDGWQFDLTPYIWLPTISSDLNYPPSPPGGGGGGPGVDVGPTDWFDLLNGIAFINGGARRGRFSFNGDFVYLSLKSEHDRVTSASDGTRLPVDAGLNVSTQSNFDGASWTIAAGYRLHDSQRADLELLGGVRYLGLDVSTAWDLTVDITGPGGGVVLPAQGRRELDLDLWDGILGIRGNLKIGDGRWAMPFYLDVGSGSSAVTWQATFGFSYRYDWGELMFVYRHLYFDEGSGAFLENLTLSGPTIGARFRF